MVSAINNDKKNKNSHYVEFSKRLKRLVKLINAEEFDFEDLDSWRMGAVLDTKFVEYQTEKNHEFNEFKINMKSKVSEQTIKSEREIEDMVRNKKEQMLEDLKGKVKCINSLELNADCKSKLTRLLSDRLESLRYDVVQE